LIFGIKELGHVPFYLIARANPPTIPTIQQP